MLFVGLGLYLVVLIRTAWVSDDAYITYRTISNLAGGNGPVWNVGERVQAYTHPLWMLLIAAGVYFTHEFYFTGLLVSILVSLAAVGLLTLGGARTQPLGLFAIGGLIGSRAFVDYSTSGLENPLTHLLLAGYLLVYFRGAGSAWRLTGLAFLAALIGLNRLDALLLVLPSLLSVAWRERWRPALRSMAIGFLPLVLWEAFSVVYYGFPLPNTAYAKLVSGVPTAELTQQGLYYLMNSLNVDPLTLALIVAGVAASTAVDRRRSAVVGLGVLLYLAYVVRIGGDFMSGRFLSAPLVSSVAVLLRARLRGNWAVAGLILVVALGLAAPYPTLASGADYGSQGAQWIDGWGISDERAVYYPGTGLLQARRHVDMPNHPWVHQGRAARGAEGVALLPVGAGFFGFYAGSGAHLLDLVGLADPLLARLPAAPDPFWRIGHFERRVPAGYLETLRSGENRIAEPHLREYYDQLSMIVRGPLFRLERWRAIWRMNVGVDNHLLRAYQRSLPREVTVEQIGGSEPGISIPADGLRVRWGSVQHVRTIRLRLERSVDYLAVFALDSREVGRKLIPKIGSGVPVIDDHLLRVSAGVAELGYDAVTLHPAEGRGDLYLFEFEVPEG